MNAGPVVLSLLVMRGVGKLDPSSRMGEAQPSALGPPTVGPLVSPQ